MSRINKGERHLIDLYKENPKRAREEVQASIVGRSMALTHRKEDKEYVQNCQAKDAKLDLQKGLQKEAAREAKRQKYQGVQLMDAIQLDELVKDWNSFDLNNLKEQLRAWKATEQDVKWDVDFKKRWRTEFSLGASVSKKSTQAYLMACLRLVGILRQFILHPRAYLVITMRK